MSSTIQNAVLSACREFMKPVARLLLKNGIGYQEFSEVCKIAFVDVASTDFGIRGRKTNMSRVAVMTGLSRKEVRKVRDAIEDGSLASTLRTRRPELILSLWHSDPSFLDSDRNPKSIKFEGEEPSFRDLVSQVGGDIPPRAMLNELLRAGSVVEEGEMLRVVSRSYIPDPDEPQTILVAGDSVRDLVSTIHHNLGSIDPDLRYFERRVYSERLPTSQRARFRRLARERGELLLRDFNAWLSERELTRDKVECDGGFESRTPRIGVGIYFFDDMPIASFTKPYKPSDVDE